MDTSWETNEENYRLFFRSLKPYRKTIAGLIALFMGLGIIQVVSPFFVKFAVREVMDQQSMKVFYYYAGIAVAIFSVGVILEMGERYASLNFSYRFTNKLKKMMFANVASQPFSVGEDYSSGRMIAKLSYNVGLLRMGIEQWALVFCKQIILFIGLILFSFFIHKVLFWVTLGLIPFMVVFTLVIQKVVKKYVNATQTKNAQITETLYDLFRSWPVLKLFRLEEKISQRFNEHVDEDEYYRVRRSIIYTAISVGVHISSSIVMLGLGGYMLYSAIHGHSQARQVLLYIFYTGYLARIFTQILSSSSYFEAMKIGILTTFPYLPESLKLEIPILGKKDFSQGDIEFKNVHFRYGGAKFRFRGLSFKIPAASKILLLGSSGVGKSSAMKLIKGVYHPLGGSILIDGISASQLSSQCQREKIAYLSSEERFFESSWLNNLILHPSSSLTGSQEIKEIINLFYEFGLEDFVEKYRDHLGVKVTSGCLLSSTETQILLALQVLRFKPKIILMDQFFAALHPDSRLKIQKFINQHMPRATLIYVDHQPNDYFEYSKVLRLQGGEIEEVSAIS